MPVDAVSSPWRRAVTLTVALLVLDASLTFKNLWPTPAIRWTGDLSIELAACLLLFLWLSRHGHSVSRRLLTWLGVLWVALVLGRYVDVTAPALWGRQLNFYWDLQFVPDVAAMLAKAARPWLVTVTIVVAAATLALVYLGARVSLARVAAAAGRRTERRVLWAVSIAIAMLFGIHKVSPTLVQAPVIAAPVTQSYARQAEFIVNAITRRRVLPPSPSFDTDLSRVAGADILLFFIESYGAVAFERPEYASVLEPWRQRLAQAIHASGHQVVSAFVESPTFGGSSWFAHITLLSGLDVGDPDTNALLMTEHRDTLPLALGRHGYRPVAVMPGLWYPWPEGSFYGFSEIYNGPRLKYQGPPIGWWDMPDQFTLARLDELELNVNNRAPSFVFFPTVSTHTPFSPRAPYQPDWPRMLTSHPYETADIQRAYEEEIDWMNLGPSYAKAVAYTYETLAGYLRKHQDGDFVMILIGDHQPPALVSGEGAPWDVPVHVITNRQAVLAQLVASGFVDGLTPRRPSFGRMSALLPALLHAFGDPETGSRPASADKESTP